MDKDEYDENSDDTEEDDEIGDDTEEDDNIGGDTASKDKEEYDTKEGLNEKQQQNVDNVNGSAVFEKLTSETFLGTGESNLFLQWMNYILMKIQLTMHVGTKRIIPDPELPQDPTSAHAEAAQRRTIEELLVGPDSPGLKTLRPEFLRLAPPLFLRDDEMIWQDPVDLSHITYE